MNKIETKVNIPSKKGDINLFKDRLKTARINAGFSSQEALADIVGVDRVTISYYEKGDRKPDIDVFIKIADALNVSYDYLLGYSKSSIRENHEASALLKLSDKAIEVLKTEALEASKTAEEFDCFNQMCKQSHYTINYLLENDLKYGFFNNLGNYLWFNEKNKKLIDLKQDITNDDFGYTMSIKQWEATTKISIDETLFAIKSDIEKENNLLNNKKKK